MGQIYLSESTTRFCGNVKNNEEKKVLKEC